MKRIWTAALAGQVALRRKAQLGRHLLAFSDVELVTAADGAAPCS